MALASLNSEKFHLLSECHVMEHVAVNSSIVAFIQLMKEKFEFPCLSILGGGA